MPSLRQGINFIVQNLQLQLLFLIFDPLIAHPRHIRHVITVPINHFYNPETSTTHRCNNRTSVPSKLIVLDLKHASILGEVVRRLFNVHAHAELSRAAFDRSTQHQSVAGLIDMQWTGRKRKR